ncbi:FtsQ-type POTRA domain-containing protein [Colidextribacter sp. 210702-DFI.3.9]|nr:FtsQ-type POTRA domain-containing protein [Colidextribacter sp. 210702-DFI.3.9]
MASPRNKRKRKRGKGRLGPLFKLLCAGAVAVALTMGATVFFQVETVAVTGNSRYSQEEIIKATGIQTGDNLFRMNKYQIAHQVLQGLPYVEELTIRRALPSTIVITVKEWDAVARVEAPGTSAVVQAVPQAPAEPVQPDSSQAGDSADQSQPELSPDQSQAAGDTGGDSSSEDTQEDAKPATQAWLISVGGKLLEPAPADSTAISVTGITPLSPRAGEMLVLSQEEQPKLTALLALLQGLEDYDMLADTASIALGDTHVELRYLDRFTVKLSLVGDMDYKLQALKAAVPEAEKKLGEQTTGTFDLTQESITAVYTPD